jgi:hypothetical protein
MPKAVTEVPALPPWSRHLTCGGAETSASDPKQDIRSRPGHHARRCRLASRVQRRLWDIGDIVNLIEAAE